MADEKQFKNDFLVVFKTHVKNLIDNGAGSELKKLCAQIDERFKNKFFKGEMTLAPRIFSALRESAVTGVDSDGFGLDISHYNQIANRLKDKGILKKFESATFTHLWSNPNFKRIKSLLNEAKAAGDNPIDVKTIVTSADVDELLSELTRAELGTLDPSLRELLAKEASFARANIQYTENKLHPFIEEEGLNGDSDDPSSMLMRTVYKKTYGREAYLDATFKFVSENDFINDMKTEYLKATGKNIAGETFEEIRTALVNESVVEANEKKKAIDDAAGNREALDKAKRKPTPIKNAINRIRHAISEQVGINKILVTEKAIEGFNEYLKASGINPIKSHFDIKDRGLGGMFIQFIEGVPGTKGVYNFETSPYDLFSNQDRSRYIIPIAKEDMKDTVKSFLHDCAVSVNKVGNAEKAVALDAISREVYDVDLFGYVQKDLNVGKLIKKYTGFAYGDPGKTREMTAKIREFLAEFDPRIIEQGWKYAAPSTAQNQIERLVATACELNSIVIPKLTPAEEKDEELGYGKKKAIEAIKADQKRLFDWFNDNLRMLEQNSEKIIWAAKSDVTGGFNLGSAVVNTPYMTETGNRLKMLGAVDGMIVRYKKEITNNIVNGNAHKAVTDEIERYRDMGYGDAVNYLTLEDAAEANINRLGANKLNRLGGGEAFEKAMVEALSGVGEVKTDVQNVLTLSHYLKKANAEGAITDYEITEMIRLYNNMVEVENLKKGKNPSTDKISLYNDSAIDLAAKAIPILDPFKRENKKDNQKWSGREADIEKMERFYVSKLMHYNVIRNETENYYSKIEELCDKLLLDAKEEGLLDLCDKDENGEPVSTMVGVDEILKHLYDKDQEIFMNFETQGALSSDLKIIEANKNAIIEVTKFNDLKNSVSDATKTFILENSEKILENKRNGLPAFEGIEKPDNIFFTDEELEKIVEKTATVEAKESVIHEATALRRRAKALSRLTFINPEGDFVNLDEKEGISQYPQGFDEDESVIVSRFATSYTSEDSGSETDEAEIAARVSAKHLESLSAAEAEQLRQATAKAYYAEKGEALKIAKECDDLMDEIRNSDDEEAKNFLKELEEENAADPQIESTYVALKEALKSKCRVSVDNDEVDLTQFTEETASSIKEYALRLGIDGGIDEDGKLKLSSEAIKKDFARRYFVSAIENGHDMGVFVDAIVKSREIGDNQIDLEKSKVSKAIDDVFGEAVKTNYENDGSRFHSFFENADGKNSERAYVGYFKAGQKIEEQMKDVNIETLDKIQELRHKYEAIRKSQEKDLKELDKLISKVSHEKTLKDCTVGEVRDFVKCFSSDNVKGAVDALLPLNERDDFKQTVHGNIDYNLLRNVKTKDDLKRETTYNPLHKFTNFLPHGEGYMHDEYLKKIGKEARRRIDFWDLKRLKKFNDMLDRFGLSFAMNPKTAERYGIDSAIDCFSVSKQIFAAFKLLHALGGLAYLVGVTAIPKTVAFASDVVGATSALGYAGTKFGASAAFGIVNRPINLFGSVVYGTKKLSDAIVDAGEDTIKSLGDVKKSAINALAENNALDNRYSGSESKIVDKLLSSSSLLTDQEKALIKSEIMDGDIKGQVEELRSMVRQMFPNQMSLRGDSSVAPLLSDDLYTASVFKDRIEKIVKKIDEKADYIYHNLDRSSQNPEELRDLYRNYIKLSAVGKTFIEYLSTDVNLSQSELANIEGNVFNMLKNTDLQNVLDEARSAGLKASTISAEHQRSLQKNLAESPDLAALYNMEEALFSKILDPRAKMNEIQANKKGEELMASYLRTLQTEQLKDIVKQNGAIDYKKLLEALGAYSMAADKMADEVVMKYGTQMTAYKNETAALSPNDPKRKANELAVTHLKELIEKEDTHRQARNRRLDLMVSFVMANAKTKNIDIDTNILDETNLPPIAANKLRRIIENKKKGFHYTDVERYYNGVEM